MLEKESSLSEKSWIKCFESDFEGYFRYKSRFWVIKSPQWVELFTLEFHVKIQTALRFLKIHNIKIKFKLERTSNFWKVTRKSEKSPQNEWQGQKKLLADVIKTFLCYKLDLKSSLFSESETGHKIPFSNTPPAAFWNFINIFYLNCQPSPPQCAVNKIYSAEKRRKSNLHHNKFIKQS